VTLNVALTVRRNVSIECTGTAIPAFSRPAYGRMSAYFMAVTWGTAWPSMIRHYPVYTDAIVHRAATGEGQYGTRNFK
jgi:hypothetical protein